MPRTATSTRSAPRGADLLTIPLFAAILTAAPPATLQAQQQFLPASAQNLPGQVRCGDLDGDGDLDLISPTTVFLNDGRGSFHGGRTLPGDPSSKVTLGDFDSDHDLDLVLARSGQRDRLFVNDGSARFTEATANRMPFRPFGYHDLALGDVDGDGDVDIVAGCGSQFGSASNTLHLNDGAGNFTDATANLPQFFRNTNAVAMGDVDGDGDLDLVFGNWAPNPQLAQDQLLLNDGTGRFTDVTATHLPVIADYTNRLELADLDLDGDLDLLLYDSRRVHLYRNDGSGTFTDATTTTLPANAISAPCMAVADLDADGDPDLLFGRGTAGNQYLANDGSGHFTDVTAARMSVSGYAHDHIVVGDLDRDGDLDLVFEQDPARVLSNLVNHLRAESTPTVGTAYRLRVYASYGQPRQSDLAVPCLAAADATIPIPSLGTLGLAPGSAIALQPVLLSPATGSAAVTIPVPNQPSLAGTEVFGQALVIRDSVPTQLTNTIRNVVR